MDYETAYNLGVVAGFIFKVVMPPFLLLPFQIFVSVVIVVAAILGSL